MRRKKEKIPWMGLKIDMEKAYDRLEWEFLHKVMKCFGFPKVSGCFNALQPLLSLFSSMKLPMSSSNLKKALGKGTLYPFSYLFEQGRSYLEWLERHVLMTGSRGTNYLKIVNQLLIYNLLMIYLSLPMQGRLMQMASRSVLIHSQHGRAKR